MRRAWCCALLIVVGACSADDEPVTADSEFDSALDSISADGSGDVGEPTDLGLEDTTLGDVDVDSEVDAYDPMDGVSDGISEVTDGPDVPTEATWWTVPLGAAGDLYRGRLLDGFGFRLVGANATILRPLGDGWVRESAPWSTLDLYDIAANGDDVQAVGAAGSWLRRTKDGSWQHWANDIEVTLRAIAIASDGALAAGDQGAIVRRTGSTTVWEASEAGVQWNALATAGNQTFAVGSEGRVKRRVSNDGSPSWQNDAGAQVTTTFRDAWVLSDDSLWAVGDGGTIAHFTGGWTVESTPNSSDLRGVSGSAGQIVAVGHAGEFITRASDGSWSQSKDLEGPLLAHLDYHSVVMGGDRGIACGVNGALQAKELPDGSWQDRSADPGVDIVALDSNQSIVAGVGPKGLLFRIDEETYGAVDSGTGTDLLAVEVADDKTLWAVGAGGVVVRSRSGKAPLVIFADAPVALVGVTTLSGTRFALSRVGSVLQVGAQWAADIGYVGHAGTYRGLTTDGERLIAFGAAGRLMRQSSAGWVRDDLPIAGALNDAALTDDAGLMVAVGDGGAIVTWTGLEPPIVAIGPGAVPYAGIASNGDGAAMLVGWAGTVHGWTPETVQELAAPTSRPIHAVAYLHDGPVLGGADAELWMLRLTLP